ncbi:universal stress protein [Natronobiforma cellulositropha]|uniref:universal stress protein n=1 Tax=Natronobiforma cellulositropha TaxID=1679076 RepID=UPI0021D57794|nr:universal stress protein [Natronobiforma cellulositropha]
MGEHVLIPVDGSPAARRAVEYACNRFEDATLTLLYVMDPMVDYQRRRAFPGYTEEHGFKNEREKAEYVLESTLETVPDGVSVETEIDAGNPATRIVQYADDNDVDHVVIGSHGKRGVARYLLGSVAETVVRRSAAPVTVVRPNE